MAEPRGDQGGLTGGSTDRTEIAVPAPQLAPGATNGPSSALSDAEGVSSRVSSGDQDVLIALIGHGGIEYAGKPQPDQCTNCARAVAAAARILAAGWRPPLPVSPPLSREELGRRVCEIALRWSREDGDRPGSTAAWETLSPDLRELHMRVGEALFALGMTWSPTPSSPPPGSVTEWSYRYPDGYVVVAPVTEVQARRYCNLDQASTLVRREVGPWIEVQP